MFESTSRHFTFLPSAPLGAIITREFHGHSTSPTGYRSDFLQASLAASWSSPIAYAQDKAQELHAELLKEQRKQQKATKRKSKDGKT